MVIVRLRRGKFFLGGGGGGGLCHRWNVIAHG